ncbi:hypothetical protein J1605_011292 [Eschrichtius robustus]|nr:hypothetical protein J1605_011292 [Eschrichtius robustus]
MANGISDVRRKAPGLLPEREGRLEFRLEASLSSSSRHHEQSSPSRVEEVMKLNGGRHVQGILRGFDPFMNLVIDECVEMATSGQQNNIGMVVIRGNSIIMLEALERV